MTAKELYAAIGGNYEDALSRLMNDRLVIKFIRKFPADPSFSQLMAARETGDAEGMFRASHTLKGVAANLGLTDFAALASEICECYRPGKEQPTTPEALAARFAKLGDMYEKICDTLSHFEGEVCCICV